MAMFLITRGIKPADVLNLDPGSTPFPASVIDMLMGNLGQPVGGWPKKMQKIILGDRKPLRGRPGASLKPLNLDKVRDEVSAKTKRPASDDDLYSYLMYPEVFADYAKFARDYSDVSVLPTPSFFYGLKPVEEISVDIEEGKTLFIKLINIGAVDKDGRRTVTYELNGMPREATVADKSVATKAKVRAKADPADLTQLGAPIPGLITALSATVGSKVAKGDKLVTLEAMKMQTTIYAATDGTVDKVFVAVGDTVESKDLLVKLRS
jgi:pyruvate carboxylase